MASPRSCGSRDDERPPPTLPGATMLWMQQPRTPRNIERDTGVVYHFTDTARLPWILMSGELRPGSNRIGGMPSRDFLWATIDLRGDRSASLSLEMYREGRTRMVRFTLQADDFEPWRQLIDRHPAWTSDCIERLVRTARSSPNTWHIRAEPLPSRSWISVETRSYADNRWLPFEGPLGGRVIVNCGDGFMGVRIAGTVFASRQQQFSDGSTGYQIW